ncbi:MAG: RNA polymerase sigma-70 factor [Acidobacteriota bacterium]|nr:RNA polymerase sigma-70 factor [Acidobacteriota bacterium]
MTRREALLDELRPLAFRVAYRMLGSVSEAEDIVQEALLRVHQALDTGERIASPQAYVTTVATRLAIDELRSARARRELYVGEWLPEPIVTDDPADPARQAEIADSISMAMLLVLESLSPEERAAFLLHDAFDYPYREIAPIIGKNEDYARQLASRARRHVAEHKPRFETTREHQGELARRFFLAADTGDLAELEALLADDVVLTGDGGGKVPALARAVNGRSRVARVLRNWSRARSQIVGGVRFHLVEVNGGPGALILDDRDRVAGALALEIVDARITRVMSVVNPDKLAHIGVVANFRELFGRGEPSESAS